MASIGSINTNHFTGGIDEWSTGVTAINCGIGLDHIGKGFIGGARGIRGSETTTFTRDDAGGHGVLVGAKRVANSYNLLTDVSGLAVTNFDWSKIFDVFDFNNGKIIDWVGADKFDIFISRTIVEDDANFGSISNDVLVGGDITIATDDKTGTSSLRDLTGKERTGGTSVRNDGNDALRDRIGNFRN